MYMYCPVCVCVIACVCVFLLCVHAKSAYVLSKLIRLRHLFGTDSDLSHLVSCCSFMFYYFTICTVPNARDLQESVIRSVHSQVSHCNS